jgi:TolA-binding protein
MAEEPSSSGFARDPDTRSDQRIGRRRMKPSMDPPRHRFGEGPLASGRPSIGRRIFRTLVRFSIAVLIGVGATLGWQSYGDEAREMLVAQAPALGGVLSVSTTKSPVVAAISTDPTRQLASLASTLDAVRRSVEQLSAKQEQMAQNIAALRAVEEDVRQKMSSAPSAPAPAQQATSVPQPKPPQAKIESRLPPSAGSQLSR